MRRPLVLAAVLFLLWAPGAYAWTWPVQGPVLLGFVFDPSHPYAGGQHRGIDIGAATGTAVGAPASGTVSFAGTVPTSGKSVTIATPDGYSVTLTHLGSIEVVKGAAVGEGAEVGTVGPSGTPELDVPYLYMGVRVTANAQGYLDPLSFLPALPPPVASSPTPPPATAPDPAPSPATPTTTPAEAPPPDAAAAPPGPTSEATSTPTSGADDVSAPAGAPPPDATAPSAEAPAPDAAAAPPDPTPDATSTPTSGAGDVPAPADAPPPDTTTPSADAPPPAAAAAPPDPMPDATSTPTSGAGDISAPAAASPPDTSSDAPAPPPTGDAGATVMRSRRHRRTRPCSTRIPASTRPRTTRRPSWPPATRPRPRSRPSRWRSPWRPTSLPTTHSVSTWRFPPSRRSPHPRRRSGERPHPPSRPCTLRVGARCRSRCTACHAAACPLSYRRRGGIPPFRFPPRRGRSSLFRAVDARRGRSTFCPRSHAQPAPEPFV